MAEKPVLTKQSIPYKGDRETYSHPVNSFLSVRQKVVQVPPVNSPTGAFPKETDESRGEPLS